MIARLLISSDLDTREKGINQLLSDSKISNPHLDLLYFEADSKLGIEQARKIKEHFSLKPFSAKGRVVVIEEASELTLEAQNALLKTIEELPKQALFILGASSDAKLLPTVLSRCQIIVLPKPDVGYVDTSGYSLIIEKLMDSSIEQRFEYVEKLKDKKEFLSSLVTYFHHNLPSHLRRGLAAQEGGNTNYVDFLKELLQAEAWAKQNVNIRAVLEYLMLIMPNSDKIR